MRRFVPLALAATMAMGNFAFTSAATGEPIITDTVGDANGFTGQGIVLGAGDNAGPGSQDWADLTHFSVIPDKRKSELRLGVGSLSSTNNVIFRIMTTIDDCAVWFQITSEDSTVVGSTRLTADCGSSVAGVYTDGVTVDLDEDTSEYVMTLNFSKLDSNVKPYVKSGKEGVGLELSSRLIAATPAASATVPQMDDAFDEDVSFKL
ncbi:MAG: hypothetical protein ACI867_002155 [Glaciecola sp.]|jgi:hypothetical protein